MTGIGIMRRVHWVSRRLDNAASSRAGAFWDDNPCREGTCRYIPVETGQYDCPGVCGYI